MCIGDSSKRLAESRCLDIVRAWYPTISASVLSGVLGNVGGKSEQIGQIGQVRQQVAGLVTSIGCHGNKYLLSANSFDKNWQMSNEFQLPKILIDLK